jgi:cytochrome c biogenesis factor
VTADNGDDVVTATLNVLRDGKPAGTVKPRLVYPIQTQQEGSATMKVALIQQPLKDIFISFNGVDQAGNAVITIKFFPMQWWVWAGFIVTILGSGLAMWPKRTPQAA